MATIQIREIPEDAYEVIRERAARFALALQALLPPEVTGFGVQLALPPGAGLTLTVIG